MQHKELQILLASKSPRRKQLFEMAAFNTIIISIDADESFDAAMPIDEVSVYLAEKKSSFYKESIDESSLLVTADTIVVINNTILNKPKNHSEALKMLQELSGNWHQVHTGVCMRTEQNQFSFNEITEVYIDQLTTEEIEYYIKTYQPYDKAGSYGVQDWIGVTHVSQLKGCYYNVMGFPMPRFYKELKKNNLI